MATIPRGAASRYLDTDALSGMLGQRAHGSVNMPAERRERIEHALQVLQAWQDDPVLVKFVGELDDPSLAASAGLEIISSRRSMHDRDRGFHSGR